MLAIHSDSLFVVGVAARAAERSVGSRRLDPDLARQLRRAATSVPLNLSEGFSLEGGNRSLRYLTALGSARELRACFEVAFAMGYVEPLAFDDADRLDKVIATLVKLCR